jgi:hypothetical protein
MDFLDFASVTFPPRTKIGQLREDLNKIIGHGLWYDTFQAQNIKWVWLLNNVVTAMNNGDKILCGAFGLYRSFVAGILDSVKEIHFYVLCEKS